MIRRLLSLALGVVLLLPALAYASPPDPTWIGGLYDDADYDDVVLLVTTDPMCPLVSLGRYPDPHWVAVCLIPLLDDAEQAATPPPPHPSRGPPLF